MTHKSIDTTVDTAVAIDNQNTDPTIMPTKSGTSKLASMKANVEETKNILLDTVQKVLIRDEELNRLVDKSEDLEANSKRFSSVSHKLKKKMCCQSLKMTIIFWAVILLVLLIVLLAIILPITKK